MECLSSPASAREAQWTAVGRVSQLWAFPVKSCAPLHLTQARARPRGLQDAEHGVRDRSYIIINNNSKGLMVTGRMCPQTVLVTPVLETNGDLTLGYKDRQPITITAGQRDQGTVRQTKVWAYEVAGADCGDEASAWLSAILNRDVRLLYHDEATTTRIAGPEGPNPLPLLKPDQDAPLYADYTSYMLMSEASVQDVGRCADLELSPLRFRPNIVVSSLAEEDAAMTPYEEDNWGYIKIGETAVFRNVKPCSRCTFTCVDSTTGVKNRDMQPLKTLKKHRMPGEWTDPLLGINLGLEFEGLLNVGDTVYAMQ